MRETCGTFKCIPVSQPSLLHRSKQQKEQHQQQKNNKKYSWITSSSRSVQQQQWQQPANFLSIPTFFSITKHSSFPWLPVHLLCIFFSSSKKKEHAWDMTKNLISKCLACRRPSQAGGQRQICKYLQSMIYVYSIYQLISGSRKWLQKHTLRLTPANESSFCSTSRLQRIQESKLWILVAADLHDTLMQLEFFSWLLADWCPHMTATHSKVV